MLALQDGNSPLRHQIGKLIGSLGEEKFEVRAAKHAEQDFSRRPVLGISI